MARKFFSLFIFQHNFAILLQPLGCWDCRCAPPHFPENPVSNDLALESLLGISGKGAHTPRTVSRVLSTINSEMFDV